MTAGSQAWFWHRTPPPRQVMTFPQIGLCLKLVAMTAPASSSDISRKVAARTFVALFFYG